jgi:hypothetical protein
LSTHVPFQSTQINEYANVGMGRDDFYSYSSLADTLYYHGYYSGGNNYVYYLPLPYLVFPMNFSDSIRVRKPIMNATLSVQTGTVTRYWIYDGFGTIKFPYGTENNVYRIRTKQIDSLMVNGFFISATVNEELIWIKQSDGIPVLRLQKQGVSNMYAYYASAQGTSSISEISENNSLRVYPNPGTDFIYLSNKGSLKEKKYTISDYLGRVVLNGILKSEEVEIDIRTIPNGFYLFQVEGSVNQKVKIIKN